ncbi:carbohydrate ABC transporter substrate-binding protein, CUT1 family [Carnobacterium iners]|uniref:Carbohydrate ABC transporter substrate-binding protein, CUT1 family n=1 Tax=Carnobacterium iners TaxID=1073423 RepID=A0A1X7MU19_9LACT|nr:extracellular solute-binding protein [Carnobacterium iners]SEK55756.1 carbohydrate ABC transporter substrate-binding protein, CUT1 family [Carnobacterium iners]SMH28324.1 carbohydrate ABC transporter substrate-binding protein, CUT1 family [Carnobacterium iners]
MKKWKKIIGIGVTLSAALLMTACGGSGENETGSGDEKSDFTGDTLTVGVWGGNEAEEGSLDKMISLFEDETGSKIEKKVYTDYNTQIQADLAGKTAPDVFYVDSYMYPWFSQNETLADLKNSEFESDKFYESLTDSFTTDGKLQAIPKDMSTLALYLNTEIFEKAGVSLDEIPSSYEEYVKWLPEFQEKIDAAYGEGKVFAMSYNQDLARNYHLAAREDGMPINEDGTANLESEKVVENLTILKELVATKAVVTPEEIGAGWNGEAFGSGKIAIMDEGNWVYQTLKDEFPDIPFTVQKMPTYKDTEGSMMFSVGWGKYAGTEQSELADKWIQYATGVDGMKLWIEGTGTLPSRQDVAAKANITENADLKVHLEAWEYATIWQNGTTLDTINKAYQNFVTSALDGSETFKSAMEKADEQANADINPE